tara:strand:+ start:58152 stop:58406 length:255 start_codon:yes stop_codon:yes gene_type:complete
VTTQILHTILSDWHLRRVLGLLAGIFFLIQSLMYKDPIVGLLSGIFFFQVLTNKGCFGRSGCSIPSTDLKEENESKEPNYIEVN